VLSIVSFKKVLFLQLLSVADQVDIVPDSPAVRGLGA
jgi:hypothetical protein